MDIVKPSKYKRCCMYASFHCVCWVYFILCFIIVCLLVYTLLNLLIVQRTHHLYITTPHQLSPPPSLHWIDSQTVPDLFHLMRRQFTPVEWEYIRHPRDEFEQLSRFYRLWVSHWRHAGIIWKPMVQPPFPDVVACGSFVRRWHVTWLWLDTARELSVLNRVKTSIYLYIVEPLYKGHPV